ncbi:MAG: transcriptional regulator with XRE-family HTH domain [Sphingobacteriales bacterium]|jgi:transcriptional regulator with XRE-family HTH domain
MYFSENLKLLRTRMGKSQQDIADELNLKRTSLSGYENGGIQPPFQVLLSLCDYYNVSVDTLMRMNLSKVGEKKLSEIERGLNIDLEGNRLRVITTSVDNNDVENIEVVNVKAKAGYTEGYADPDFIKILPTFQLPFLSRNRKYRSFQIKGDSMPPVPDGSFITGEYVDNWRLIKNGYPYIVVLHEDGVVFKMVYNKIEDNGSLLLCSTNPKYDPYEVKMRDVIEVWSFVNFISSELDSPNLSRDQIGDTLMELKKDVSEIKQRMYE